MSALYRWAGFLWAPTAHFVLPKLGLNDVLALSATALSSQLESCPLYILLALLTVFYQLIAAAQVVTALTSLAKETIESKGGHFAKLKLFCIAKITILWRVFKFKRGHGPLISTAYASDSYSHHVASTRLKTINLYFTCNFDSYTNLG